MLCAFENRGSLGTLGIFVFVYKKNCTFCEHYDKHNVQRVI
jgi:hypothetical protein